MDGFPIMTGSWQCGWGVQLNSISSALDRFCKMETSLGRFFVCFFVRMILEKNYCNVVNPIMNHPQKSQFLWVGFQPSPNGRFIVGLPTLCVWIVRSWARISHTSACPISGAKSNMFHFPLLADDTQVPSIGGIALLPTFGFWRWFCLVMTPWNDHGKSETGVNCTRCRQSKCILLIVPWLRDGCHGCHGCHDPRPWFWLTIPTSDTSVIGEWLDVTHDGHLCHG